MTADPTVTTDDALLALQREHPHAVAAHNDCCDAVSRVEKAYFAERPDFPSDRSCLDDYHAACRAIGDRLGLPALEDASCAAGGHAAQVAIDIVSMPANTLEGVIAKMRVLQMWMKEDPPTGVLPECDLIAVNGLLADLERLAGRAS